MGNNSSKKDAGLYSRPPSKRWRKNSKPRDYWKAVSDLDTEFKIPVHLQYQSHDSVEEDFFTIDSRNPCLIHLHQLARNDFNGVFHGAQAYAKPVRPKSFDPNMLLDDKSDSDLMLPSKSTVNIAASRDLNELFNPRGLLPTPEKKMELDNAQHKAELVSVDTSGTQFDRRVNYRRSQRSTVSGTRKSQMKIRERHKTLTALPDYVSSELGMYCMQRQNSLHSDVNSTSSFVGDGSIVSADSSISPRTRPNGDVKTLESRDISSPIRRRLKNRHSMPSAKAVYNSSPRGAHIILNHLTDDACDTVEQSKVEEAPPGVVSDHVINKQQILLREKNGATEDRISSGFWSGTESCRHSTTSEILSPVNHITTSSKQGFARNQDEIHVNIPDNDTNASSLSINSRLSTLDCSLSSSSLTCGAVDQTLTPNDSMITQRIEPITPRRFNFSTPAGAYNFMNPDYVEEPTQLPHLASPMDLLIIGNRRGSDGMIRDPMETFDTSETSYVTDIDTTDGVNSDLPKAVGFNNNNVFTPNTPQTAIPALSSSPLPPNQTRFFPNNFSSNHTPPLHSSSSTTPQSTSSNATIDFQSELKARLEHDKQRKTSVRKPPPPRRQSSLKSRHKEVKEILAYMEPLSSINNTIKDQESTTSPEEPSSFVPPSLSSPVKESRRSTSSSEVDNSGSPPPSIPSYQPSKSVASMLSKRPSNRYSFHLPHSSPIDRPVSVVEPIPQSFPSPPLSPVTDLISPSSSLSICKLPDVESTPCSDSVKQTSSEDNDDAVSGFAISPALLQNASNSLKKVKKVQRTPSQSSVNQTRAESLSPPRDNNVLSNSVSLSSKSTKSQDLDNKSITNGAPSNVKPLPPPISAKPTKTTTLENRKEDHVTSLSPQKPRIAAKPSVSQNRKPLVRPKPALLPRPISHPNMNGDVQQQPNAKRQHVKERTASLRADFFRHLSSTDSTNEVAESKNKPITNDIHRTNEIKTLNNEVKDEADVKFHNGFHQSDENQKSSVFSSEQTQAPEMTKPDENDLNSVKTNINDSIENKQADQVDKPAADLQQEASIISSNNIKNVADFDPTDTVFCNGVTPSNQLDQINSDNLTADVFSSPLSSTKKFDFKSSMHRLRGAYSTMPLENGHTTKSPTSSLTYDRKSNNRYSTSSLERRRKTHSSATSRDDFKSLLLQSLSKSNTGSQMSATEKLQMSIQNRNQVSSESLSDSNADSSRTQMVSTGDIRAVMGASRPGRRPNRVLDHRRSYAGSPSYLNKKHPPLSMSGRYSARSRTPTRPMMAISEDVENDFSTDKISDDFSRSKSVGDF